MESLQLSRGAESGASLVMAPGCRRAIQLALVRGGQPSHRGCGQLPSPRGFLERDHHDGRRRRNFGRFLTRKEALVRAPLAAWAVATDAQATYSSPTTVRRRASAKVL